MKVLFEAEDAVLKFDEDKQLFVYIWNGIISMETLKSVVLETAKRVEKLDKANLYFDRRNLESYSPEAKDWVKNDFMKNDGKRLIKKVDKIAAVSSKSVMAQLIATLLVGVLRLYNRSIKYEVFAQPELAEAWLAQVSKV